MIFIFTPEERAKLEAIDKEELDAIQTLQEIKGRAGIDSPEFDAAKKAYTKGEAKRQQTFSALLEEMEAARFSKLKTPAEILRDAKQQTKDAIVYVYVRVLAFVPDEDKTNGKQFIVNMASGGMNQYAGNWDYEAEFLRQRRKKFIAAGSPVLLDAAGMTSYALREVLRLHTEALKDKAEAASLQEIVEAIIYASPYTVDSTEAPRKAKVITADSALFNTNIPMFSGKATEALATLSSRSITENPITDKGILQTETGDFKLVFYGISKIKGKPSINTHKLLSVGIGEFTKINDSRSSKINPTITMPFEEYARLLGYEIDERPTDNPEAAVKEKKRAAEAVKTAKKRIRQDLELLQASRWTWQEKVRGKVADFDSILLFERVAILKGYIIMEFGRNMAEYLKKLPINQYHRGLLSIDARKPNAYNMGLKMTEHYNIDNNLIAGTANRLKVSTLLAVTDLPTLETLQNEKQDNSRQWYARIKEPFEKALDELTGKVIANWEYVKPKGEPLTDAEAYTITDYVTFTGLLVQFKILDAPDHEERLARREEEKKLAAARNAT